MSNVSNEEIMGMLKILIEKVEGLESIKTDNVTITSSAVTIKCGDASAVGIETAEEVLIQTIGKSPISVEHAENVSVDNLESKCKKGK